MRYKFDHDVNGKPSRDYIDILKDKTVNGAPAFKFLGTVKAFHRRENIPKRPKVNALVIEFLKSKKPELIVNGDELKTKYRLTAKYPLAEYTSLSKYANDYGVPFEVPWNNAQIIASEAFNVMDGANVLDIDSSMQWLERKSSPGYPWSLADNSKEVILDSDWFRGWYISWENAVLNEKVDSFFWKGFIKEEFKKDADVIQHNPRTILASPIQATVLAYRLFGDMNDRLSKAGQNFKVPCFIGVKKFNRVWNQLALALLRFPNIVHGDCKRFDGTLSPFPFEFIARFRTSCLRSPGFSRAIKFFYKNVLKSQIVGWWGDLFEKVLGQPSGQGNTLHDNSIVHSLYFFYHWCLVVVDNIHFLPTWASFKKNVFLMVMGDDVIYSYSHEVGDLMSIEKVTTSFRSIGVVMIGHKVENLSEAEFCSMTFHDYHGVFVPKMKKEKMLASMFLKDDIHPRVYLRRLFSLRIEVWWDIELRDLIEDVIEYIENKYMVDLLSPVTYQGSDDATYDLIKTLHWSRFMIEKHYLQPSC